MKIGVEQDMLRLHTGHVAVSIVEFGDGFRVPTHFCAKQSQAWTFRSVPNWTEHPVAHAHAPAMPRALAALVAAFVVFSFLARLAGDDGRFQTATAETRQTPAPEARAIGAGSLAAPPTGAEDDGRGGGIKLNDTLRQFEPVQGGRSACADGMHPRQGQVPGSAIGEVPMHTVLTPRRSMEPTAR